MIEKTEFKKIRILLENTDDQNERSRLAKEFIKKYDLAEVISNQVILAWFVAGTTEENWQNLYLLDSTIPYLKNKVRPAWHKRMLYFPGTYIMEEKTLLNKHITFRGQSVKFLYTRGSGDHRAVHAGPGTNSADFYFWIDDKPVFVEYKFASKSNYHTVEDVKKHYETGDHLHNAKVVVTFLEAEKAFYIIDYKNNTVEKLDITAPTAFIGTDDFNNFEDPLK